MSNTVLVIGPSGSGKSTSLRNLDPTSTFIINVLDKPMPFKGHGKNYVSIANGNEEKGNYYATDDWDKIIRCIKLIDKKRPDIKTLIIDDLQYIMANEFMRRATEKGYEKFTEMAQHIWEIINNLASTRNDLFSFVLCHSEIDSLGVSKVKTIGKLLDDKITLEGMFTCVFHSKIDNGAYKFMTQSDGFHIAKSPLGMFDEILVDNDLSIIREKISSYYEE